MDNLETRNQKPLTVRILFFADLLIIAGLLAFVFWYSMASRWAPIGSAEPELRVTALVWVVIFAILTTGFWIYNRKLNLGIIFITATFLFIPLIYLIFLYGWGIFLSDLIHLFWLTGYVLWPIYFYNLAVLAFPASAMRKLLQIVLAGIFVPIIFSIIGYSVISVLQAKQQSEERQETIERVQSSVDIKDFKEELSVDPETGRKVIKIIANLTIPEKGGYNILPEFKPLGGEGYATQCPYYCEKTMVDGEIQSVWFLKTFKPGAHEVIFFLPPPSRGYPGGIWEGRYKFEVKIELLQDKDKDIDYGRDDYFRFQRETLVKKEYITNSYTTADFQ